MYSFLNREQLERSCSRNFAQQQLVLQLAEDSGSHDMLDHPLQHVLAALADRIRVGARTARLNKCGGQRSCRSCHVGGPHLSTSPEVPPLLSEGRTHLRVQNRLHVRTFAFLSPRSLLSLSEPAWCIIPWRCLRAA